MRGVMTAAGTLPLLDSILNNLSCLSKASFTVFTQFSANPFEDGWDSLVENAVYKFCKLG